MRVDNIGFAGAEVDAVGVDQIDVFLLAQSIDQCGFALDRLGEPGAVAAGLLGARE